MRAEEIQGLMEAYSKVNATPEVLSEGVVNLSDEDLEGIELIEMTMEEIDQLNEAGQPGAAIAQQAKRQRVAAQGQVKSALGQGKGIGLQSASGLGQGTKPGQKAFGTQMGGRQGVVVKGGASGPDYGPRGGSSFTRAADTVNVGGQTLYKAKKGNDIVYLQGKGKPQLFKPGQSAPAKPGTPTPAPKPTTPAAAPKPTTPAAAPKPTTPVAAPKPAGSAMDQWAAANPKLAAAKAERDRTRGTSATTNPLMKDMKANLPAPKSPSPSTAKTGFDLAKKGVNLAAGVDLFDLVKGHLLDEGYADSEEGAMVIMVNMSEEWRKSILESYGVELDEASYSAKAARAGKDIGKPGKMFGKIAKEAGERYGSEERGKKVAGAVLAKLRKEEVEEIDEAQEAREKPEEHEEKEEKENEKKYGHVRGEKTPMPPRGDKRREEFEKWYAKQMGR